MKKIALIAGGYTDEDVISYKSAKNIYNALTQSADLEVYNINITKDKWICAIEGVEYKVDKNDFSVTIKENKIIFDFAFIIIHGTPGEDGKLQGYFDMLHIPYNTCNAATSAITMNKAYTKAIVAGIPQLFVAKSMAMTINNQNIEDIKSLKLPLFVKTNSGGSSLGMSKVKDYESMPNALTLAFKHDNEVLIEEFISGREFTIGVAKINGKIQVLPATEIKSSKEFFDYEAKYTPGLTQEITPADITEIQKNTVEAIVKQVYTCLNCAGVVRIDFFLEHQTNDFYFIEINTVPGQSDQSIIPQQVRAMGGNLVDFYRSLINV